MDLKRKRINCIAVIILLSLILLSPFLVKTQAWVHSVDITQNPSANNVEAGEKVNITATIDNLLGKVTVARLAYNINRGSTVVTYCNEELPTSNNAITWTIGPFDYGDKITFEIVLKFEISDDYYSEKQTFTILAEDESTNGDSNGFFTPTNTIILYIVAGLALTIVIVAVIIKLKRK